MREPTTRRDQREIVVPRDTRRGASTGRAAPRGATRHPASGSAVSEALATLAAFGSWSGRVVLTRPGEAFGAIAALVAVGVVTVNALGSQAGRHPAPILPQPVAAHAGVESAAVAKAPPFPAATAQTAADSGSKDRPDPKHPEKAPARDAIGDILRSAGETTASVAPKTADRIGQAQRALAKLGYGAIKADGVMGPGTRAAIEKFERDRKLPVTGEAAGRTLRELASRASGVKG